MHQIVRPHLSVLRLGVRPHSAVVHLDVCLHLATVFVCCTTGEGSSLKYLARKEKHNAVLLGEARCEAWPEVGGQFYLLWQRHHEYIPISDDTFPIQLFPHLRLLGSAHLKEQVQFSVIWILELYFTIVLRTSQPPMRGVAGGRVEEYPLYCRLGSALTPAIQQTIDDSGFITNINKPMIHFQNLTRWLCKTEKASHSLSLSLSKGCITADSLGTNPEWSS